MKRPLLYFISALLCLSSCSKDMTEEKPYTECPDIEKKYDSYQDSIADISLYTTLQTHTRGNGFAIVIMADGYSQFEIANGKYDKAILAAQNALFEKEPMKSLREYCDVIKVTVPSKHSGIDYIKRNTGLATYLPNADDTNVFGDSIAIQKCTIKALLQHYKITTYEELNQRINQTLTITLLNTSEYKGVTLLAEGDSTSVTDSIPNGFSLAYVPAYAEVNIRNGKEILTYDIVPYLIRHEAVGHGIGKLGDEYFYEERVTPPSNVITAFKESQSRGNFQNVMFNDGATNTNAPLPIPATSWLYDFTQDPRYAGEDFNWYVGAFEYATQFCRFGNYSIMNGTINNQDYTADPNKNTFNVASRAMIYKRIMKAAANSYQWDYEAFATADVPGHEEYLSYNATYARGITPQTAPQLLTPLPRHTEPKIVKFKLPQIK